MNRPEEYKEFNLEIVPDSEGFRRDADVVRDFTRRIVFTAKFAVGVKSIVEVTSKRLRQRGVIYVDIKASEENRRHKSLHFWRHNLMRLDASEWINGWPLMRILAWTSQEFLRLLLITVSWSVVPFARGEYLNSPYKYRAITIDRRRKGADSLSATAYSVD